MLLKEQVIKLKNNIEINQDKEEENFSCNRINPSTNLQLFNNSSKVVIDKLGKKLKKNKLLKKLNSRLIYVRY